MYVATGEKPSVVIDRLKRQNFSMLGDLEKLMNLFEKKFNDPNLVGTLKNCCEQNNRVAKIDDLKKLMAPKKYATLMKGFTF